MRKSISYMMVCLVMVFALAACGGGDNGDNGNGNGENGNGDTAANGNGGGSAAADHFAIYRTVGNSWRVRNVTQMEGMDDMVSYMHTEVIEVTDDYAKTKMTMLDADGEPNEHVPPTESEVPFTTAEATNGDAPEVEQTEESITVEAGEFNCIVTEAGGVKTWMSKDHPGLMVRSEHGSGYSELVEYNID
jgi:hypothetical protein